MPAKKIPKTSIKKTEKPVIKNKKQDLEPIGGFESPTKVKKSSKSKLLMFIIILIILILIAVALWYGNTKCSETQKKTLELQATDISGKLEQLVEETTEQEELEKIEEVEQDIGVIKDTPTGYLNVRKGPDVNYDIVTKVNPGTEYVVLDEQNNWYQIEIDENLSGWVYGEYLERI